MLLAEDLSVVADEAGHLTHRDPEVVQRRRQVTALALEHLRRPAASELLKDRTVWSLRARVCTKPSSSRTEPNSWSLLSARVPLSRLKFSIVRWNFAPWPPKFRAVVSSRSVSAPFLFAPFGPERDGEVVEARVDLVELERHRGAVLGRGCCRWRAPARRRTPG